MKRPSLLEQDFKHNPSRSGKKFHPVAHIAILAVTISLGGLFFGLGTDNAQAVNETAASVKQDDRYTIDLQIPSAPESSLDEQANADDHWKTYTVGNGDSLATIFSRAGLKPGQLHQLVTQDKKVKKQLTRLVPGQTFKLHINQEGDLEELIYQTSDTAALKASRLGDRYVFEQDQRDYERRVTYAKGVIKSSLFEAAKDAGLSESLTMDMAYIFGWDIDFALDMREGDSFTVMYEELFLDGKRVGEGNIVAAEFVNQNREHKAVRYTDARGHSGYYTPDGRSMRKAFLRTPVDFSRISSRFGKRKHPILNSMRAHKGVDYAASRGTPVKASGDGRIVYRGRKGGYGKTVVIDHGNGYSTLYAHLNNYARKAGAGKRVKQGQVIGFVGSTGRATGPHLHYEFRVHGHHRNPLTVKLPKAASIPRKYKQDFELATHTWLAQLDLISETNVAVLSL